MIDNGSYGTIRMHQERSYPRRVSGTSIDNPDFAAIAQAYGMFTAVVETAGDFPGQFQAALQAGVPALIHLHTDVETISPAMTIGALRQPG